MNGRIKYQVSIPAPNGIGNQQIGFFTLVGARALAQAYGVKNIWDCVNDCYLPAKVDEPDLELIVDVLGFDRSKYSMPTNARVAEAIRWINVRVATLMVQTNDVVPNLRKQAMVEWLKAKLPTV